MGIQRGSGRINYFVPQPGAQNPNGVELGNKVILPNGEIGNVVSAGFVWARVEFLSGTKQIALNWLKPVFETWEDSLPGYDCEGDMEWVESRPDLCF